MEKPFCQTAVKQNITEMLSDNKLNNLKWYLLNNLKWYLQLHSDFKLFVCVSLTLTIIHYFVFFYVHVLLASMFFVSFLLSF